MKKRPSLSVSLASGLKAAAESRGFLAYVPVVLLLCVVLGFGAAWSVPVNFWADGQWSTTTAVFAGLLAFNGLLMSLGWFAFSRIYEILMSEPLNSMLTRNDLLGVHLAFIDMSHAVLVGASVLSATGLILTLAAAPIIADRIVLGSCLALTLYSLWRAFGATRMVNDLVWEQAHLREKKPNLQSVQRDTR